MTGQLTTARWALPTEKQVQRSILELLTSFGFRVRSTSQYRASHVAVGLPDLIFHHRTKTGLGGWFEVKRPRAKTRQGIPYHPHRPETWEPEPLRPEQEDFRRDALRAGQLHYWGTQADALEMLVELGLARRAGSWIEHVRRTS